jgi:arylformamidase
VTRFVELGHPLEDGLAGFPTRVAGSLGTGLDDPRQRGEAGYLSGIPLAAVAGLPGLVVDAAVPPRAIALQLPESTAQDRAVLIRTGWDNRWGTEGYREAAPLLGSETIDVLIRDGAALVGIDFSAIDAPRERAGVARLLRAGVPVIENLCNLSALPAEGFRFFAVPFAITGQARSPVRAFAELLPR